MLISDGDGQLRRLSSLICITKCAMRWLEVLGVSAPLDSNCKIKMTDEMNFLRAENVFALSLEGSPYAMLDFQSLGYSTI